MPILHNEAKEDEYAPLFPEIAPRMQAAIAYLKSKGITRIAIAGHSLGSTMSAYYLASGPSPVAGLVAVGTSGTGFTKPGLKYFDTVPKLSKLPILDIYGSEDTPDVLKTVAKRMEIAKKSGNTRYTQVKVAGANHFFQGKDKELVNEVSQWLDKSVAK